MSYPSRKWRTQIIATVSVLICFSLVTIALWRSAASQKYSVSNTQTISADAKLREGVGTEIKLASGNVSLDQARSSVESVSNFIHGRSGLAMGEDTKARLSGIEQQALKDIVKRVSVEKFINVLTDTLCERISNLTDSEINFAATTFNRNGGFLLRADGRLVMIPGEFDIQAKALREQCQQNDKVIRESIKDTLQTEVNSRIKLLEAGAPEQFSEVAKTGLTPLQAILVTYSVVADDLLDYSQAELREAVRNPANIRDGLHGKIPMGGKAYGPNGRLYASPVNLVFNKATVSSLLDRLEKGGNEK